MRVVSKAKARHQPAPHPGIQLVNHKGNSSTLTNRLLGTTLRWGSTRWWKTKVVVVVVISDVVIGVSGRRCAIGWSRCPCGRRCIVRRIFV